MKPKEFDMELIRGDTLPISFNIQDNEGNPLVPTLDDELYFTMKKNYNSPSFVCQKKLSSGDFEIVEDKIRFVLTHEDTANLGYGEYVYDIQLSTGNYVKTIVLGTITLTEESTWINNE
jgi:hypothetical protein